MPSKPVFLGARLASLPMRAQERSVSSEDGMDCVLAECDDDTGDFVDFFFEVFFAQTIWVEFKYMVEWLRFHWVAKRLNGSIDFQRDCCDRTQKTSKTRKSFAFDSTNRFDKKSEVYFFTDCWKLEKRSKWITSIYWNKWTTGSETLIGSYHFMLICSISR